MMRPNSIITQLNLQLHDSMKQCGSFLVLHLKALLNSIIHYLKHANNPILKETVKICVDSWNKACMSSVQWFYYMAADTN